MTTTELYQQFIAGRTLPSLGIRQARSLLDYCRNALLSRGKKLRPSTATTPDSLKTELLQAHRELVGGDAVYAMATTGEAQLCNGVSNERLLDEYEKFKRTNPNGSFLQHMATMGSDPSAPRCAATPSAPARPPAKPSAPARPTPAAPSPLADYSNSKLAWLAGHRSATASDKANARAELARRGATITASGIVSQSSRRQPRK